LRYTRLTGNLTGLMKKWCHDEAVTTAAAITQQQVMDFVIAFAIVTITLLEEEYNDNNQQLATTARTMFMYRSLPGRVVKKFQELHGPRHPV